MSLIKLASHIIVINKQDPNNGTSKTFNPRNIAAAGAGAIGGFGGSEAALAVKGFDKLKRSHRFGQRMGATAGAFTAAAATYGLLHKHKKDTQPDMMFY